MTVEAEQQEHYRDVRQRLMGAGHSDVNVRMPEILPTKPVKRVARYAPPFEHEILLPAIVSHTIMQETAAKHGLTMGELMSHRRSRTIVDARHESFWRLSKETSLSLPEMGRRMGGFDHTTAIWGIRQHQRKIDGLPRLKRMPDR